MILKTLRSKFYQKMAVLSAIIFIFFYAVSYQPEGGKIRLELEECEREEGKWIKKIVRRSYKEAPGWKFFLKVYARQSGGIIRQTIFFSFLSFLWPWKESGIWIASSILMMLSIKTFGECYFLRKPSDRGRKWIVWYGGMLKQAGSIYILISLLFGIWGLGQIIKPGLWDLSSCLAAGTVVGRAQAWPESIYHKGAIKIEGNNAGYKFTIGGLHWQVPKENHFDVKVFCVLLLTALDEQGQAVISTRQINAALGLKSHARVANWAHHYRREGKTFLALRAVEQKAHFTKVRAELMAILKENPRISLMEMQEKLRAKGFTQISQEQIKASLRNVNFLELYESWALATSEEGASKFTAFGPAPKVKIENKVDRYRIYLGNLYWDIAKDNQFALAGLLQVLTQARDYNEQKITGTKRLGKMLLCQSWQDVQRLLAKYRIVGRRFCELKHVGETIRNEPLEKKCRKLIMEMWLDDISLTRKEIAKKLREFGIEITAQKIRELIRQVDFWPIMKRWREEYQTGKYRKAYQWLLTRYARLNDELLNRLSQGKALVQAEVDSYIGCFCRKDSEKSIKLHKDPMSGEKNYAWLKCFLFHLPKTLDGHVCCPSCGSFATKRKTLVPKIHLALDPQSGKMRQVSTFRFRCCNPDCSTQTFSASPDNEHLLQEETYARGCLMLRLVMGLCGSYRAVADLLGTSKSVIYDELTRFAYMTLHWQEILGPVRFSGTLCLDEKYVRIAELKKSNPKYPFAYLFFAVDPATYDLLHIEIFASRDSENAALFLRQLKAKGIYPTTIMTDLTSCYDSAVREVYGRSVTLARCHFHFKKNIFDHLHKQFGKKNIPEIAQEVKDKIFHVVDAKARKTIRKRNQALLAEKDQYLAREPRLLPMFTCLSHYLPHLLRVLENPRVTISTNNDCERVIRNFNQRYKTMKRFKTLETARRHAQLFQLFYRFTPLSQDVENDAKRGKAPLQIAGYHIEEMPIFQYLTAPLLFNIKPAQNLASLQAKKVS
jgi:transposase-like protein/transposase